MTSSVLILGARGRFGRHAAAAFAEAGWQVRPFRRGDNLDSAATGAQVIVNAWNPPYPQWRTQVPGLTAQVIAAARSSGARVILPGNVYVFGAGAPPVLSSGTPHAASNPLGRIRVEMESAYRASGVPTLVLRCGDFIDDAASGNWFDKVLAARVRRGVFVYPGPRDVSHAWAWLPDAARAAVALAELGDRLPVFAEVPFPGYTLTGNDLHAAVELALGRPLRAAALPWWALRLVAPVWPMGRGLVEMRYLWSMPHRLDPGPLSSVLPDFRATPLPDALRAALAPLA
jgi:nucleoside-diphosphate-sugar epimerase